MRAIALIAERNGGIGVIGEVLSWSLQKNAVWRPADSSKVDLSRALYRVSRKRNVKLPFRLNDEYLSSRDEYLSSSKKISFYFLYS